jgi:Tol biopolymer transport system component
MMRRVRALTVLVLAAGTPLAAQRDTVLRQVKLPHTYYWLEMYVPQVTSGPSGATWSPDGRDLVYSMQGSLWRQTVGDTVAVQLTDGPGYDLQPDWSPDGSRIVFARWAGDTIELQLLDLASGAIAPLTANGAVNLDPRWSPDGHRVAFVSSAYAGRWHVYLATLRGGMPGDVARLTEDHESGLPRRYYSRYDHYLSPTWSPDGSELILVSNRGHIHGTGGFWRMRAEAGSSLVELRYEETTWKARPDWSPDGKRVVYSSYLCSTRRNFTPDSGIIRECWTSGSTTCSPITPATPTRRWPASILPTPSSPISRTRRADCSATCTRTTAGPIRSI